MKIHLVHTRALEGKYYSHFHLTPEETEEERSLSNLEEGGQTGSTVSVTAPPYTVGLST